MAVRLHLIAAPWALPNIPSASIGYLKAYVDREFRGEVETETHSAFLKILYDVWGYELHSQFKDLSALGEIIYQMLYMRRYPMEGSSIADRELADCIDHVNASVARNRANNLSGFHLKQGGRLLSVELLDRIEKATFDYIDRFIAPRLNPEDDHVVGFSLVFNQVYPSMFMAKRILETQAGKSRPHFVFGGFSASFPHIGTLLSQAGIEGWTVFGEGERRLEFFLRELVTTGKPPEPVSCLKMGLFPIGSSLSAMVERSPQLFDAELTEVDSLPVPDYDEYFEMERQLRAADPFLARLTPAAQWIPIEGTRGCFAKCDFCSHNQTVGSYRKQTSEAVYEKLTALRKRYGLNWFYFVDSLADAHAEKLADLLIEEGSETHFFMFLRADHPQRFWVKLAAAGLCGVNVGLEALSTPLLKAMNKKTTVIAALRTLKYLCELGVGFSSGLITRHPKAGAGDIAETLRLLPQLKHFSPPLSPRVFMLGVGSPIFNGLESETKAGLVFWETLLLPEKLRPYSAGGWYVLPPELQVSAEDATTWTEIEDFVYGWYTSQTSPQFSVDCLADGTLKIVDRRRGERIFSLSALAADIYESCHDGLNFSQLEKRVGAPPETVRAELDQLVDANLILHVDGHYLSLAFRPRKDVFVGYDTKAGERPATDVAYGAHESSWSPLTPEM